MHLMIAYCGLNCMTCEAYQVTQANDEPGKQRLVEKWRIEYNAPEIDVAGVTCDGCHASSGRLGAHCYECEIRACGLGRGLANCAYCGDYETCGILSNFFNMVPHVKITLDGIRTGRSV
ncbi:MAG: DUF3795 domain-containing protein [Anaerolineae bacterium]|nr:DUF3795 domain-containing protein [Anaerolineae bacterium]